MSAHDGIVNLIPELKSNRKTNAEAMRVEDLSQDINALFGKYYESQKGTPPNEELMGIFQEVIACQKNS
jgi:exonuclease SbcD